MGQLPREQLNVAAERAVLAGLTLPGRFVDRRDRYGELRSLAKTAGAEVVGELVQKRRNPHPRTFLGKGKVEELAHLVEMTKATLIIFDHDLAPSQIRALEPSVNCKIIDRSELILDIFANRATTHMAKLQVEIAQLEYTYPRLRAMWTHLGQITGGAPVGIGTRGPGEKQLEIDRRLVQRRLSQLKRELADIQARRTREVANRNTDHYTVGLVGYTNAGKSTLFNRLTEGGAFANDQLFATLSTRIEAWDLGGGNAAMLSDTVGFIRDLPHHLVASFRSTLEETVLAQLIVIVLDVADPNAEMHLRTVNETLDSIGACDQRRVLVLNKLDQLDNPDDLFVWLNRHPEALPISAVTGEGLDDLGALTLHAMLGGVHEVTVEAQLRDGDTIAFIERRAMVLEREYGDGTVSMRVKLGRRHVDQLLARGSSLTINGKSAREAKAELWPEPEESAEVRVPPHRSLAAELWGKVS
ncbi:MAG: GTPase HflX [Planctomycetota bacterium]